MRVIRMLHPQIENYKNTYFKNKKKMNEEEMDKAAWTKITFSLCVTCKNKYWNTIFQEKHIPLFLFRSHRIVAVVSLGTDQHLWSHSRYFLPFADLLPISRSKAHRSMVKSQISTLRIVHVGPNFWWYNKKPIGWPTIERPLLFYSHYKRNIGQLLHSHDTNWMAKSFVSEDIKNV